MTPMSTNSRKTMKTIPIWVRSWPCNILNLKTVKPYPPKQCVPMLLYLPPPYRPHWENLQLAFKVRDVNSSDWELLTPSTLPQMSTLAKIGANFKAVCPNSQSSRTSSVVEEAKWSSQHMFKTANPPQSSRTSSVVEEAKWSSQHMFKTANPPQISRTSSVVEEAKWSSQHMFKTANPLLPRCWPMRADLEVPTVPFISPPIINVIAFQSFSFSQ